MMGKSADEDVEKIKKEMVDDMMSGKNSTEEYPSGPIEVNDENFQETLEKYPLVLVDFWAAWCGPCKMMEPVMEELAAEYEGDAVIAKMNVDKNNRVPSQFQVSSIPTLVLFKDGEKVERMMGARQKGQLAQKLDQYVEN